MADQLFDSREGAGRLLVAACLVLPGVALGAALRLVLLHRFAPGGMLAGSTLPVLAGGLLLDGAITVVAACPLLAALGALRLRVLARPAVRLIAFTLVFASQAFLSVVEYCFFEEFDARFNRIAIDYALYPHEVFFNVWESYPVPLVIAGCVAAGLALGALATRATRAFRPGPRTWSARWRGALAAASAGALCLVALRAAPQRFAVDRVRSEVTANDLHQLARAWSTADVDYDLYYRTLPAAEAHRRAARVLGLDRRLGPEGVRGDAARPRVAPRWDVVIVLEESLGSEFVGALGRAGSLTPGLDRWSREGLLLTNLVATGNRTVRGIEGTLSSFVPLPGDAVVKRDDVHGVTTIANVFRNSGYATCFFYGGVGFFDHVKPFVTMHGYEEFVEQSDFPDDAFATAWGVADEVVFDALLARQLESSRRHEPLLATLLTVSNHRPFDVPPDRIDCPEGRSRACAVRYADWALARYLDQARDAGLLQHTLVLVVGDHGARVYGSERLPASSYRIPGLFLVPDDAWRGRRIERLCSQVDLAPTILGLVGIELEPAFFGSDVTSQPSADGGRAFVQHNRDIGLLTDEELVVLSLHSKVEYYRRSGRQSDELVPVRPDARLRELEKDAIAVYETAYHVVHAEFDMQRSVSGQ